MKRVLLATTIATGLTTLPTTASADFIGVTVGGYSWQQEYSGSVQSGLTSIDLEDQLALDDDNGNVVYVAFEHPIPGIPNVRLQHTEMEISETSTLTTNIDFNGTSYTATTTLDTQSDFSHTDLTGYYEILDNWISVDIGLTMRYVDGDIQLTDVATSSTSSESFEAVLPMLYVATKFELPLTGFYLAAEANGTSIGDADLIDYRVSAGYESSLGFGAELGIRSFDLDYEDGSERADFEVEGAYVGVFYHF